MTDVTGFTPASTPPAVSITSTLSRTNSAAISAARSRLPPAQRYSIATVRPSIQPSSASRRTKAAVQALHAEDVAPPKIPTVGSFACCADAASGHAAAARYKRAAFHCSVPPVRAYNRKDTTPQLRQEPATLRDFKPVDDSFGSVASD